ncbi:MAG: Fic family protein [Acidimicrobiia bacterium]|nr:Fic family protein [Acidimicrobiia bacterium]
MDLEGTEAPIVWRGRRASAFVPTLLAERDLALAPSASIAVGRALAGVEQGAAALPEDYAPLARLLLRAEGVASSYIEGVAAPLLDVVLAEADAVDEHTPAAWVAANLAAISAAVDGAASAPLSVEVLCDWHRVLMAGSPTPARYVGVVRGEQGWIGGASPLDAHLVAPPPAELPRLLDDVIRHANRDDVDPIVQAAVVHAQFEVLHPFGDGNGRVGRILVAWVLVRRLALLTAPPVSVRVAADVGGYTAGLTQFRYGMLDEWVRWFADTVSGAGQAQQDLVAAVDALRSRWHEQLAAPRDSERRLRSDAAAWKVLDLLPRHVVLSAPLVATELGLPLKSAHAALADLVAARVLVEHGAARRSGRGRPPRLFTSPALLGLAGASPIHR